MAKIPLPTPVSIRRVAGICLVLAGLLYVLFGWPESKTTIRYESLGKPGPPPQWIAELNPYYPADSLQTFQISQDSNQPLALSAVHYKDHKGTQRSALFFPPAADGPETSVRLELWREVGKSIRENAPPDALVLTWWDNAQRVNFLTGLATWIQGPAEEAYPDSKASDFWNTAAGGFMPGDQNRQLARWLTMDADAAQQEMRKVLPTDRSVYILVCLDDLARLAEIETLAGRQMPFEVKVFPQSDNIHTQVTAVRRWAGERGTNSYLVQQLPAGGVRAWRITNEDGKQSLLARLLPFTTSLAKPLENQKLVYQSRWGAYLSLYQWKP